MHAIRYCRRSRENAVEHVGYLGSGYLASGTITNRADNVSSQETFVGLPGAQVSSGLGDEFVDHRRDRESFTPLLSVGNRVAPVLHRVPKPERLLASRGQAPCWIVPDRIATLSRAALQAVDEAPRLRAGGYPQAKAASFRVIKHETLPWRGFQSANFCVGQGTCRHLTSSRDLGRHGVTKRCYYLQRLATS